MIARDQFKPKLLQNVIHTYDLGQLTWFWVSWMHIKNLHTLLECHLVSKYGTPQHTHRHTHLHLHLHFYFYTLDKNNTLSYGHVLAPWNSHDIVYVHFALPLGRCPKTLPLKWECYIVHIHIVPFKRYRLDDGEENRLLSIGWSFSLFWGLHVQHTVDIKLTPTTQRIK